ncbi:hypothetical protein [Pseudonocardia sp.]|jgi:hypothetical protein|uniref:hypothetical protein n=1 Tax=Pseudonocardia sp. TaxID=60912 RepID=UPI003D0C2E14
MTTPDATFSERPSAPPELLPGLIGAVTSSVRFTSFVRDVELRGLVIDVDADCAVDLPIGTLAKQPSSLSEIFTGLRCPVVRLGFLTGHRQSWENRGTHLGEVVHSIALGPGESRSIAFVNWRRRQLTALEERTTVDERVTAVFVQNRALEEITTAVATEHQGGETQTEAGTAVTAGSFVGAGAAVGSVAGAVIGTIAEPGGGTILGALVGGAVGTIAGGVVYSGSKALGMIESQTDGDRDIVADVNQRIALSTSQTASAVRSLWSTAVVEDAQGESVSATTSNITNYNHMHALNIEYFEVLQHYQARLHAERLQPLLYLPFTFLDFTGFRFVRDYWEIVRVHIDDAALREQGDSYFVTEDVPDAPDLLPVPIEPQEPPPAEPLRITALVIDVLFDGIPFNLDVGLTVVRDGQEIFGQEQTNGVPSQALAGFDFGNRYTFDADLDDAERITAVVLSRNQVLDIEDTRFRIRVSRGAVRRGAASVRNLAGTTILGQGLIESDGPRNTTVAWLPAGGVAAADVAAREEYEAALFERDQILAENERRRAAFEALTQDIERFRNRLQKLVLRRRHFFTRVILDAVEPEEITQLLESVTIGHADSGAERLRLSDLAHTIPLGTTAGAFVLKLKRLDPAAVKGLFGALGLTDVPAELDILAGFADTTLRSFEKRHDQLSRVDDIYVPTGGLFAEAVLGRSNSAEYLDMQRYFNWQDSPIPHQPPAIDPVSTASRFQRGDVSVTVPEGDLQVINPVTFPDPTGLSGVLAAVQNPAIFRDMSGASQLAGVLGSLSTLAGQIGQVATTMTGQAAQDALRAATDVSQAAAGLAQAMVDAPVTSGPPSTITNDGAALNASRDLDAQTVAALAPPGGAPPPVEPSDTTRDIPRNVAGLPTTAPRRPRQGRSPALTTSLVVRDPNGRPILFDRLADVRKVFRLYHPQLEPQLHEFTSATEAANPFYTLPVEWPRPNGMITMALEVAGFAFTNSAQFTIPDGGDQMLITATFATKPVTITRQENESHSDAVTRTIQGKLGVSIDAAETVKVLLEGGGGVSGTGTDTDGSSDSRSEIVRVPIDGLIDLALGFTSG